MLQTRFIWSKLVIPKVQCQSKWIRYLLMFLQMKHSIWNTFVISDPILFFDCGIHAREWISSATCLYLIQEGRILIWVNEQVKCHHSNYIVSSKNFQFKFSLSQKLVLIFDNKSMIESMDSLSKYLPLLNYQWQFVPLLNPDGYQKSHMTDANGKGNFYF